MEMGYIGTTGTLQQESREVEEIREFLQCARYGQKAILKTFYYNEGSLYARIFYSDPKLTEIRSWTFAPGGQKAIAPDNSKTIPCPQRIRF